MLTTPSCDDRPRPLEDTLTSILRHLTGYSGRQVDALATRLGWLGEPPSTLQAAADVVGVTRERIRQMQQRFLRRVRWYPIALHSLDHAMDLLAKNAPCTASDAQTLLRLHGLARVDFHPASIIAAAITFGQPVRVWVDHHRQLVLPLGTLDGGPDLRTLANVAKAQARAFGVANVQRVLAELDRRHVMLDRTVARHVLQTTHELEFLDTDWFWHRRGAVQRNRLRNATRQMLSVCSPLSVSDLREGLARVYGLRDKRHDRSHSVAVAPSGVLRAFYRTHPEFTIDAEGSVACLTPLDPRQELSPGQHMMVSVIRAAPGCLMSRRACASTCIQRGMKQGTFALYLCYSPVVQRVDGDMLSLRGIEYSA